jgi:hypothetical protein
MKKEHATIVRLVNDRTGVFRDGATTSSWDGGTGRIVAELALIDGGPRIVSALMP